MMNFLFVLIVGFLLSPLPHAQEASRSYTHKSRLKKLAPNRNTVRKIFSSTPLISSCTKDCQSSLICTSDVLINKCPTQCSNKTGALNQKGKKVIEKWDFQRIWKQRCPGKPVPENWKTGISQKWIPAQKTAASPDSSFSLITVEKAKRIIQDIQLKSKTPGGDIKYTDQQLQKITSVLSDLPTSDMESASFSQWVNTQGAGIINCYEEAKHNSTLKVLKKKFDEFVKKNPSLKPGRTVFYTHTPFYTGILKRVASSGRDNNCLLFSFVADSVEILTKVLGNSTLATKILAKPEVRADGKQSRNFSQVRTAVMAKIKETLDKVFQHSIGYDITLREYLEDVAQKEGASSVDNLLQKLTTSNDFLDSQFAPVFSYLYKVPVYVLNPNPANKSELKYNDFAPLSHQPGKPVLIYHDGQHGAHYEKLVPTS